MGIQRLYPVSHTMYVARSGICMCSGAPGAAALQLLCVHTNVYECVSMDCSFCSPLVVVGCEPLISAQCVKVCLFLAVCLLQGNVRHHGVIHGSQLTALVVPAAAAPGGEPCSLCLLA
jgi:hypothetical protein